MNRKVYLLKKKEKRNITNWDNKDYLLDKKNHISIVNQVFLNESFEGCDAVKKAVRKKIQSYKQQDIKKNKYSEENFIKEEEVYEKLVISKLKCYYCKEKTLIMYENKREMRQWTLDRLDNSIGHDKNNVVICCLKCNLERRCINNDKFLFTKQFKLIKKV
tara:strand:- start:26 stop:508 length:483 start_codon:yes stop_codon:yes gene_type:complete